MKIEQIIQNRMQRIMLIVKHSTINIVKKEMKKFKRDLKKEVLNKIKKNG